MNNVRLTTLSKHLVRSVNISNNTLLSIQEDFSLLYLLYHPKPYRMLTCYTHSRSLPSPPYQRRVGN